jgi:hypothetical protein
MKKIIFILFCAAFSLRGYGQQFEKNLTTARSSYTSGDLGNARFAMEQMLANLDAAIGKEILTMLPAEMGSLKYNQKDDNVTGSGAGVASGLYVHRTYGLAPRSATIDIINNSPMIASINIILNTPMIGGLMHNDNQKVLKVQGYKSILQKKENSDAGKTSYELQVPLKNTLLTFKMDDTNESEIAQFANSIPIAKIAQMAE